MSLISFYRATTGDRWTPTAVLHQLYYAERERDTLGEEAYNAIMAEIEPELERADRRMAAAEWRASVRAHVGIRRAGRDIPVVVVPGSAPPVLHRGRGGKGRCIGIFGRPTWVRTTARIEVGESWTDGDEADDGATR